MGVNELMYTRRLSMSARARARAPCAPPSPPPRRAPPPGPAASSPGAAAAACAPGASSGAISSSSRARSASIPNAPGREGLARVGTGISPKTGTSTHVVSLSFSSRDAPFAFAPRGAPDETSSASSAATRRVSRSASVCRAARERGWNSSSAVGTGGRLGPSVSATLCCARAATARTPSRARTRQPPRAR